MGQGFETSDLCVIKSCFAGHYQSTWEQPRTLTQAGLYSQECVLDTTRSENWPEVKLSIPERDGGGLLLSYL